MAILLLLINNSMANKLFDPNFKIREYNDKLIECLTKKVETELIEKGSVKFYERFRGARSECDPEKIYNWNDDDILNFKIKVINKLNEQYFNIIAHSSDGSIKYKPNFYRKELL